MKSNKTFAFMYIAAIFSIATPCSFTEAARIRYLSFTPSQHTFTCDAPAEWVSLEEETPNGSVVHFLGPAEAGGAFRAAINIHFVAYRRAGSIPVEAVLKQERQSDKATGRKATAPIVWRLAGGRARRFDVTETRQLPPGQLPSGPVVIHHYYALAPSGDGYFIIKLSSTRETYLDYRDIFDHLLSTFTIIGYH